MFHIIVEQCTIRYHRIPIRMININVATTQNAGEDAKKLELLMSCQGKSKMVQACWKTYQQFPKKVGMQRAHNSAVLHLGIHPREMKTYVYTKICIWMSIAALFLLTALNWKQPDVFHQLNEQTVVYPFHRMLLSSKREHTVDTCNNLDESPQNYTEWASQPWKITHCLIPLIKPF